ncbi:acyltransferase family protein [Variovorax sp. 350MFTsu5.1]|uniref:acyltransferase family protein n=1 Tax=Variovorax sp. 350MFTsu5.1 TaxID=3158365 RepID=UPI003AAAC650
MPHPTSYRPDIDGLRAVAVLCVLAFHAFPSALPGGFIGVDVFFVISGFLITRIIRTALNTGQFSFIDFYSRRVRRIFPALVLMLVAVHVAGSMFLFSHELKSLGLHVASGAGFVSNLLLWHETGYFDAAGETKPLMHLWSLGIEEQFYIVWPLLLWGLHKFNALQARAILLLGLASLVFNILVVQLSVTTAFYAPHARAWELAAGSLLTFCNLRRVGRFANALATCGAALLVVCALTFSGRLNFPGAWAVLPVLGAALLLVAGPESAIGRRVLSHPAVVWVGLISFPLYLWHWPLLSFVRIWTGGTPAMTVQVCAVGCAVFLAWATYKFVEKPVRFGTWSGRWHASTAMLAGAALSIGVIGLTTHLTDGAAARGVPPQIAKLAETHIGPAQRDACFDLPAAETASVWSCSYGKAQSSVEIVVTGDSHAFALTPALDRLSADLDARVTAAMTAACPPLLGIQTRGHGRSDCRRFNERVFDYVKRLGVKTVVLAARWTHYSGGMTKPRDVMPLSVNGEPTDLTASRRLFEDALDQTLRQYQAVGVSVYLVLDNPQQVVAPRDAIAKSRRDVARVNDWSVPKAVHDGDQRWSRETIERIANGRATVIDFDDLLCDSRVCRLTDPAGFLYSDGDHLSVHGALVVYPAISAALRGAGPVGKPDGALQ